jgi:hypothetical protein
MQQFSEVKILLKILKYSLAFGENGKKPGIPLINCENHSA